MLFLSGLDLNGTAVSGASMLAQGTVYLSTEVDGPAPRLFKSFEGSPTRVDQWYGFVVLS